MQGFFPLLRSRLKVRLSLVSSEGVADGEAKAGEARRAEVQVVVDEIKSRFGADKETALGIKLEAGAEVCHKMFVGRIVGVIAVAASLAVDTGVQCADAAVKLKIGVLRKFGRVNGIEVQKNWAKWKGRVAT